MVNKFCVRYAVLDSNACLCTDTINVTELDSHTCNRPCAENQNEFCGGNSAQSYYDTDIKTPGPPKNLKTIKHTNSSILIQWSAPEQINLLTKYIILTNIVKTYGSKMLSSLPEWAIQDMDSIVEYELINLNPGMN